MMSDQARSPETQLLQAAALGPPRTRAKSVLFQLQQVVLLLLLGVGCYFLISRFFVQSVTVVGSSMVPTLSNSPRYLLNRWVFHVRSPQRGDIVVIRDPVDNGYSVKRIIAVGGDTLCFKEGAVCLNGMKVSEPYIPPGTVTFGPSWSEKVFTCPSGQFFVLGDNRSDSVDSRSYGPVPRANVLGLVVH